jgi:broad specificity phosphatase PhoE
VVLVRHGETEWSVTLRHTGRTDVPLDDEGRRQARALRGLLAGRTFARVLVSPLQRAVETCGLAGYGDVAQVDDRVVEIDYGDYEGRTTEDIRADAPGWSVWDTGAPGGESLDGVAARADAVIAELRAAHGDAAVFAHGHFLRLLAARWIGLGPEGGALLALSTGSVSTLGYERERPVIQQWNRQP